jgi:hypothetical protein
MVAPIYDWQRRQSNHGEHYTMMEPHSMPGNHQGRSRLPEGASVVIVVLLCLQAILWFLIGLWVGHL